MLKPKVIFLDAVGTLFGVKDSVGAAYATVASRFGVTADADALNHAFFEQFKAAETLAFPGAEPTDIPGPRICLVATRSPRNPFNRSQPSSSSPTLTVSLPISTPTFASAEPWVIYPDTYDALERWKSMGIQLGVISKFRFPHLHRVRCLDPGGLFSVDHHLHGGRSRQTRSLDFCNSPSETSVQTLLKRGTWGTATVEDYEGAQAGGVTREFGYGAPRPRVHLNK
jgi:putative hydrolase of the HAD superfamily